MSTRLVNGGHTSLPPAIIVFIIGLYKQNVRGEYFRESQSIREIRKNVSPAKISRYTVYHTEVGRNQPRICYIKEVQDGLQKVYC